MIFVYLFVYPVLACALLIAIAALVFPIFSGRPFVWKDGNLIEADGNKITVFNKATRLGISGALVCGIWFVLTDDRADVLGSSKLVFVITTFLICGIITVVSLFAICNAVLPLLIRLSDNYPAVRVIFELLIGVISFATTIAALIAGLFVLSALGIPFPFQDIGRYQ